MLLLQVVEQPATLPATGVPVLPYNRLPRIDPATTAIVALLALGEDLVAQGAEHGRDANAEMLGNSVTGPALMM